MLYIQDNLKKYFVGTIPVFDQLMALRGENFRQLSGRLTQRVMIGGKYYFIKQHTGVGWYEIIKNIFQGRWPIVGAKNEWQALRLLDTLGVTVPTVVAYGQRGINPANLQSFVLMEEVTDAISLEDYCRDWRSMPPAVQDKRVIINNVARIARIMHQHGMNHRDFYICHFLMNKQDHSILTLIDLHRAGMRKHIPERWIIKDLAGLYFSSKDIGLTRRDYCRFIRVYSNKLFSDAWRGENKFWQKVKERGERLYHEHNK